MDGYEGRGDGDGNLMYCQLFHKYVNDHECDICDSRAGYEKDAWKYTCNNSRLLHHPILREAKWWLKFDVFKFKLFICIAWFVNILKPNKRWFVHSDNQGLHVGNLNYLSELMKE